MAEAFGVAAGALTVIDLTAKVISKCKHLIETAHDAPKDLRHIFIEISSLKTTLESLQYLSAADSDFADAVRDLNEVDGAVKGCRRAVEQLAAELDGLSISTNSQTAPGKRQMLKGSLKWCLKESKARKLLEEAMQHKATISPALLGEVAQDVKHIKSSVGELRQDLDDSKRREICNWVERINPTQDHNNAIILREEQTCRWILRQPEWQDWLAGAHRFIWIHGIPGAGKTILASYIIDEATSFCSKLQVTNVCLYFYCSYRHTEDQTSSFLRWIVSQLCGHLKSIPQEIVHIHQKKAEPTIAQLKRALSALLGHIGVVYIILDAIDECNTQSGVHAADAHDARKTLLSLLAELLMDPAFAKIRILATSRNYIDIENVLKPLSAPISMSNSLVDEDIRTYVKAELQTNEKFTRWPATLMDEILEALVKGAKGMFRWAACQLHILQRKRCESDLRKALRELPETLDATYERILLDIPKHEWVYARKALLWICAHDSLPFTMGIPTNCLVSAVFSQDYSGATTEPHAYDLTALQEICGCLIRSSTFEYEYFPVFFPKYQFAVHFPSVSLAHYTVQEFLYSGRISNSKPGYFAMSKESTTREFLGTVLKLCTTIDSTTPPDYFYKSLTDYCREIGRFAPQFWEDIIIQDGDLWDLQIKVLDSLQWKLPSVYDFEVFYANDSPFTLFAWDLTSYNSANRECLVLMRLLDSSAYTMCAKFVDGQDLKSMLCAPISIYIYGDLFYGTALDACHYMIGQKRQYDHVDHLLQICQQRLDATICFLLHLAAHDHYGICEQLPNKGIKCLIEEFFTDRVGPNLAGFALTPLQITLLRWDYAGTELLLRKGANPNGIGDLDGEDFSRLDTSWGQASPLHIIRNARFYLEDQRTLLRDFQDMNQESIGDRPRGIRSRIETLLIEYSAKDFVLDGSGTRVSRGGDAPVVTRDTDFEDDEL